MILFVVMPVRYQVFLIYLSMGGSEQASAVVCLLETTHQVFASFLAGYRNSFFPFLFSSQLFFLPLLYMHFRRDYIVAESVIIQVKYFFKFDFMRNARKFAQNLESKFKN